MMFHEVFSSCISCSLAFDIHFIGHASIIPFVFEHFVLQLDFPWGLWSNPTSVSFGHILICLLVLLFLPIFVAFWMVLRFQASYLDLFLLFLPFYSMWWMRMFTM